MQTIEQEIFSADALRRSALLHADGAVLERLLADEFRYVHASGKVEFKPEYLASAGTGPSKFRSMDIAGATLNVYGGAAVMGGKVRLERNDTGEAKEHQFTAVWVRGPRGWTLVSFQNSSKPKA